MTRTIVLSGVVGFVMALLGTLIGLLVALPTVVEAQASSIRAEQFTLIDPDGAERMRLQAGPGIGAGLGVLDALHRVRLSVRTGGPAALGGTLPDVAAFAVLNPNGTPAAVLGAGRGAQGNLPLTNNLVLFDLQGNPRVTLLVAEDGTPSIRMLDAAGNVTWSAR
jgi:hypothetical protein